MVKPLIVFSGDGARNAVKGLPADLELTVISAHEIFKHPRVEGAIIVACLGGKSGTCNAIAAAKYLQSQQISAMAVVTLPFLFEGPDRTIYAQQGLQQLRPVVDYDIAIANDYINSLLGFGDTFAKIDDFICQKIVSIIHKLNENS